METIADYVVFVNTGLLLVIGCYALWARRRLTHVLDALSHLGSSVEHMTRALVHANPDASARLEAERLANGLDGSRTAAVRERLVQAVPFTVYEMPCCGHMLCWVNPRRPTYCPECGKQVLTSVRAGARFHDAHAELHFQRET